MKHAGSIAMRRAERVSVRRTGLRSIFMRIVASLHHSRQMEAARVHRRYGHLIANHRRAEPASAAPNSNQEESSADANRDKAREPAIHRTFERA
jgi:hypothetical protein